MTDKTNVELDMILDGLWIEKNISDEYTIKGKDQIKPAILNWAKEWALKNVVIDEVALRKVLGLTTTFTTNIVIECIIDRISKQDLILKRKE